MRLSLVENYRQLDDSAKRFLLFACVNLFSWQLTVGQILPLFARQLDMPKNLVGVLLALLPVSMLLVLFTLPLVEALGSRKIMLTAWLARSTGGLVVFAIPWAVAKYGQEAGWYLLLASVGLFCFFRAFGVSAWFPWVHEAIPRRRGMYFSVEMTVFQIISIGLLLGVGWYLGDYKDTGRIGKYLLLYGIGLGFGFLAAVCMLRIPGGHRQPRQPHERGGLSSYRKALRDKNYVRFLLQAGMTICALNWLGSVVILYLRDMMDFGEQFILVLVAAASAAVAVINPSWLRFSESHGSGQTLFMTTAAHSLLALSWLLVLPGHAWSRWFAFFPMMACSAFGASYWAAAHRGMLAMVPEQGRAGYTNLWIVTVAVAMGLTPVITGYIIEYGDLWGFRACFLVSGVAGLACAAGNYTLPHDGEDGMRDDEDLESVRPTQPIRTLARIAWITAGRQRQGKDS